MLDRFASEAALLREAGLPTDPERDPDRRLAASRINRLFEQAAELAGTEDFGLRLAELHQLETR